jgi:hypothetical protein
VLVTPAHQFPARKAAVAAKDDPHVRPLPAKAFHQQLQDGPAVLGPIDVGRPQIGHQQLTAAEDVQRQEAVLVIVTMKEPHLLIAMHGIIGRVKVQNQFLGRGGLGTKEGLDKDLGDLAQGLAIHAVFQTAQGGRGRQRQVHANAPFGENLKQRVFAQALVVVEVFIAQRDPEDALGQ